MKINCERPGEVKTHVNANNDVFCPICYKEACEKCIQNMAGDGILPNIQSHGFSVGTGNRIKTDAK